VVAELLKKLDAVNDAYARIENEIRREISTIPWAKVPEPEASDAYKYLQYMISNVARQSFLIMTCAWLEEAMSLVGEGSIPD